MVDAQRALHESDDAATAADISVTAADSIEELSELRSLMHEIWGPEVVPPRNLLRGMTLAGSSILLAHRHGTPIGFALGFLGWDSGLHYHSHQVGVLASERRSGVGFVLKLAQRAQCLERGVVEMRWTFDPLLVANARFNLQRLGARVVRFLPHCYGDRVDSFNTADRTDRFEVTWRLDTAVMAQVAEADRTGPPLIQLDDHGRPLRSPEAPSAGATIAVPDDYQQLRSVDPSAADAWRIVTSEVFTAAFAAGLSVADISSHGFSLCEVTPSSVAP
jgi:predicted GNAT superfamily acetyltransferase